MHAPAPRKLPRSHPLAWRVCVLRVAPLPPGHTRRCMQATAPCIPGPVSCVRVRCSQEPCRFLPSRRTSSVCGRTSVSVYCVCVASHPDLYHHTTTHNQINPREAAAQRSQPRHPFPRPPPHAAPWGLRHTACLACCAHASRIACLCAQHLASPSSVSMYHQCNYPPPSHQASLLGFGGGAARVQHPERNKRLHSRKPGGSSRTRAAWAAAYCSCHVFGVGGLEGVPAAASPLEAQRI